MRRETRQSAPVNPRARRRPSTGSSRTASPASAIGAPSWRQPFANRPPTCANPCQPKDGINDEIFLSCQPMIAPLETMDHTSGKRRNAAPTCRAATACLAVLSAVLSSVAIAEAEAAAKAGGLAKAVFTFHARITHRAHCHRTILHFLYNFHSIF